MTFKITRLTLIWSGKLGLIMVKQHLFKDEGDLYIASLLIMVKSN
jgi:hypothetical protein